MVGELLEHVRALAGLALGEVGAGSAIGSDGLPGA